MKVQCGSLDWTGKASCVEEAIIAALTDLPDNPSILLRVYDGRQWWYLDFFAALKIAGYSFPKRLYQRLEAENEN